MDTLRDIDHYRHLLTKKWISFSPTLCMHLQKESRILTIAWIEKRKEKKNDASIFKGHFSTINNARHNS